MEIQVRLYKSVIMEAAKNETFLSGRAMMAPDGSNSETVYNMQAGGDNSHESKLLRDMRSGLDSLKSHLTGYVQNDGYCSSDNIYDTMTDEYDYFDVVLDVSDRFNRGYIDALASMFSSYVSDYMIGSWWETVNPSLAATYFNRNAASLMSIKRCFMKTPPSSPVHKYPQAIVTSFYTQPFVVGVPVVIEYTLVPQNNAGGHVVDDVVVESSNPCYIRIDGTAGNYTATKLYEGGSSMITLYSRHDPDVKFEYTL